MRPDEVVLCVDPMTSLQPCPQKSLTKAAKEDRPTLVGHVYGGCGALNLFAPFDTRTGKHYGHTARRKRQVDCITFLEQLEGEIPASVKTIHIVLDNVWRHKENQVTTCLDKQVLFILHQPVYRSWMKQVERWFSILRGERLWITVFADKEKLAERLMAFIHAWYEIAHPFNWSSKSVAKLMAECQIEEATCLAKAA